MAKKKVKSKSTVRPAKKTGARKTVVKKVTGRAKPKPKSKRKTGSTKTKAVASSAEKPTSYWPKSSERQLVSVLSEDLRDTYSKLKSVMTGLGAQYIYASAKAIMFARLRCYAFVRPKKSYVELTILLDERVSHSLLKRVDVTGKRFQHVLHLKHADQIEEPLTDWLSEAYAQAPAGIPPNFRGRGGGDDVEIIEEGAVARGFTEAGDDFDWAELDPDDLER